MAKFERIESREALDKLAKHLLQQKVVAIDTEADSFYHYFDKTCLLQIATRRRVYLVDPLAMGGPQALKPLAPLFASPEIRKIFHAAEYDIFVLRRDCQFQFANLFDTMISAQLLGYPLVGLAALAERHLGFSLPKDEQRSDWSQRPLRAAQLDYAAADVAHLIALTEKLEKELRRKKRLEWAQEEFEVLQRRERAERGFDRLGYLRIKGARALDPVSLSLLRELFLVRDKRAREIDRPPFKVLANRTLLAIIERRPQGMAGLSGIKGVSNLVVRRFGREILEALKRGAKKKHGALPKKIAGASPPRRRLDRASERRLRLLKKWRKEHARELELAPGVLCPNSALEAIACEQPKGARQLAALPVVKGWFAREFGAALLESLDE